MGYENQLKVGIAMGSKVSRGESIVTLVFGYPGTGKSSYPFVLARFLNAKCNKRISCCYVRCDRFAYETLVNPQMIAQLQQAYEWAKSNTPVIWIFDEVDSLVPRRYLVPHMRPWFLDFLDRVEIDEGFLVIGITNNPENLDDAVRRRIMRSPIYFEPTPPDVLKRIIRAYLDTERCNEIYERLSNELNKLNLRVLAGSLVRACSYVRKACQDIAQMTVDQIVEELMCHIGAESKTWVDDYEHRLRAFIRLSQQYVIPRWLGV